MPADRRIIRVAPSFFDELDLQLGAERGDEGEPSATDFLVIDLPPIVERFATAFDDLPEAVVGVSSARVLIATGRLARGLAVYGILSTDGSVDLVGIELEL